MAGRTVRLNSIKYRNVERVGCLSLYGDIEIERNNHPFCYLQKEQNSAYRFALFEVVSKENYIKGGNAMSGHSKWAGIKHKKAALDAKRGQLFTKLIKELTAAARDGGGSSDTNPRLRTAIAKAKESNMPNDNVEKAIKRGTGELPGITYESVAYEGYGVSGVALVIEALTDNKNRTTAELRNILSKKGGNLAGAGSTSWLFNKKGFILVDKSSIDEEKLMNIVLEAGAEDMKSEEKNYEIISAPQDLEQVKTALKDNSIEWQVAELTQIPSSTVKLTGSSAKQILTLVETLEEHDDVQAVYANFDIPDEIMEELSSEEK